MLWAVTKHELGKACEIRRQLPDVHAEEPRPTASRRQRAATTCPARASTATATASGIRWRSTFFRIAGSRKLQGAAHRLRLHGLAPNGCRDRALVGKSGTLVAHKLSIRGADDQDHIILAAMTDDGARLDPKTAMRLFELPARKDDAAELRLPEAVKQSRSRRQRKAILDEMAARQSAWFDEEMDKLDNWAEDRRAGLKADLKELDEQIKALKKEIRQTGNLPDKLALQRQARELETKRDEAWRAYDAAAKEIEVQKDGFLDQVEERLAQSVSDEELFAISFEVK